MKILIQNKIWKQDLEVEYVTSSYMNSMLFK